MTSQCPQLIKKSISPERMSASQGNNNNNNSEYNDEDDDEDKVAGKERNEDSILKPETVQPQAFQHPLQHLPKNDTFTQLRNKKKRTTFKKLSLNNYQGLQDEDELTSPTLSVKQRKRIYSSDHNHSSAFLALNNNNTNYDINHGQNTQFNSSMTSISMSTNQMFGHLQHHHHHHHQVNGITSTSSQNNPLIVNSGHKNSLDKQQQFLQQGSTLLPGVSFVSGQTFVGTRNRYNSNLILAENQKQQEDYMDKNYGVMTGYDEQNELRYYICLELFDKFKAFKFYFPSNNIQNVLKGYQRFNQLKSLAKNKRKIPVTPTASITKAK